MNQMKITAQKGIHPERGTVPNLGKALSWISSDTQSSSRAHQQGGIYRPRWASSSCRSDLLVPPVPVVFNLPRLWDRGLECTEFGPEAAAWPLAWYLDFGLQALPTEGFPLSPWQTSMTGCLETLRGSKDQVQGPKKT